MISREQAEQKIYQKINEPWLEWRDKPEMVVVETEEREFGWVVYWSSRPWVETKDFSHALLGNAPYYVTRVDGLLIELSTVGLAKRIEEVEVELRNQA